MIIHTKSSHVGNAIHYHSQRYTTHRKHWGAQVFWSIGRCPRSSWLPKQSNVSQSRFNKANSLYPRNKYPRGSRLANSSFVKHFCEHNLFNFARFQSFAAAESTILHVLTHVEHKLLVISLMSNEIFLNTDKSSLSFGIWEIARAFMIVSKEHHYLEGH